MTHRHKPAGGKRAKSGRRPDLADRYFRSAWEANYARYLNWLIQCGQVEAWDYETDTFEFPVKRGGRFYTPDFKVTERGAVTYHEVKGWMDQRSATKLRRMGTYYPQVKLLIISRLEYEDIRKKVSRMIPGWET